MTIDNGEQFSNSGIEYIYLYSYQRKLQNIKISNIVSKEFIAVVWQTGSTVIIPKFYYKDLKHFNFALPKSSSLHKVQLGSKINS